MTDNELNELFGALRRTGSESEVDAGEARLRLAFRARCRRKRLRNYLIEIAASVLVIFGLYFLLAPAGGLGPEQAGTRGQYREAPFIVLPYGQSDVPLEDPVIVRVQVPEEELNRLGVTPAPGARNVRVEADLLVGQDGIPRAVRVNRRF